MDTKLLDSIKAPADLKKLNIRQLEVLCAEIRAFLIGNVSKTGGHLSSNLGVVELTVALHRILNTPEDVIVFDVGHQCYTHKILTGRKEGFPSLRKAGGMSGFPNPDESFHDHFITGHGSTSISAAVGFARAKKIKKEPGIVVAVIGDGAFTGGMVYEGMNNVEGLDNLVVILNDNKMSISKNVGAVAGYFTQLRSNPKYYKAKSDVKGILDRTPLIGKQLKKGIQTVKTEIRRGLYHSTFFEDLGFRYIGPVDGHSLLDLCSILLNAKNNIKKPVFIHLETTKGKGFAPAEQNPAAFHGVSAFDIASVPDPDISPENSFSIVFGKKLAELGEKNSKICAITAAMKYGTGLQYFKKQHVNRFFDVGMAEEHAVTFSSGLAKSGLLPVVSIYSTFLQRAYDQIIHDVVIQNTNVMFAIDRAGIVPADGVTHQGIYDVAFLSQQHTMPIVSPANYNELVYWMEKLLLEYTGPRAIRYPRGTESEVLSAFACTEKVYNCFRAKKLATVAIVTYGSETADALQAQKLLEAENCFADVYQMVFINPISDEMVTELFSYSTILFAEESVLQGGIGEHLALQLYKKGYKGVFLSANVPESGIDHATVSEIKQELGLNGEALANKILEAL